MVVMALHTEASVATRERLTTTEAVSRLCWHLMHGEAMTTAQAAQLIGYGTEGTRMMLCRISRYLPIVQDRHGAWQLLPAKVPD